MHPDLTDKATSAAALWHSIPVAHRQATLQGRRCSPPPPAQVHTMTHLLLSQSRHSPHHALFQRLGLAWAVPAASSTPAARCEHPAPAGQCGAVPAIAAAAPGSSTWQQHPWTTGIVLPPFTAWAITNGSARSSHLPPPPGACANTHSRPKPAPGAHLGATVCWPGATPSPSRTRLVMSCGLSPWFSSCVMVPMPLRFFSSCSNVSSEQKGSTCRQQPPHE